MNFVIWHHPKLIWGIFFINFNILSKKCILIFGVKYFYIFHKNGLILIILSIFLKTIIDFSNIIPRCFRCNCMELLSTRREGACRDGVQEQIWALPESRHCSKLVFEGLLANALVQAINYLQVKCKDYFEEDACRKIFFA